jgi:endonuclease/exonuclease/phosphatase family metal-dependent hydrolase
MIDKKKPTVTVGTWNVETGGYKTQGKQDPHIILDQLPHKPQGYSQIIEGIKLMNADVIGLDDTYGWQEKGLIADLMNDTGKNVRINQLAEFKDKVQGIPIDTSICMLSSDPHSQWESVRLQTRNCLRCTVYLDVLPIDFYAVYLDFAHEKDRMEETISLVKAIKSRKNRAVILGDFNSTSDHSETNISKLILYLFDKIPRQYLRKRSYKKSGNGLIKPLDDFIFEINKRILKWMHPLCEKYKNHGPIRLLKNELHFSSAADLDSENTFPTPDMLHIPIPIIDIDHILVSPGLRIVSTRVLHDAPFTISDHYPRVAEIEITDL